MIQNFKLTNKIQLTPDIFELTYECEKEINMLPGQFITFILPGIGGRAYSILELKGKEIVLIIKKWTKEMLGRGGSIMLCDANIGDSFNGVGPAGHFTLKEKDNNKLFLGTGTGFVPLYNQINSALEKNLNSNITFIFGVREVKGVFYLKQLEKLKEKYSNFNYEIYVSREKSLSYKYGYNTDYLTKEITDKYDEYYICGAPGMIESAINTLEKLGVNNEVVFYEKY